MVLLVEDEPFIAMMIRDLLEGDGIGSVVASDAEDAIAIATSGKFTFGAVLTDVRFSRGRDGFEFVRWFRAHQPGTAMFIASGHGAKAHELQALAPGETFIAKPYDIVAVSAQLADVARKAGERR
jgi:CheY-like chemotaxis protein